MREYQRCHGGLILQQVGIRESQDAQAARLHESVTLGILLSAIVVGATVQFHDERGGFTEKIGDVRADGLLPAEFEAVEAAVAEAVPEHPLGDGQLGAKFTGEFFCSLG